MFPEHKEDMTRGCFSHVDYKKRNARMIGGETRAGHDNKAQQKLTKVRNSVYMLNEMF